MEERDLSGRWVALLMATASFALCFAVWGLVAPLSPLFREQYQLSTTETGLLVAVPVLLGSVARVPLGMLADRYGGHLIFTVLLLFLPIPVALTGLTTTYGALLGVSFLLGLAGAAFAVGVPYVAQWFRPENQGLALGIYGMGNIGTAIASFLAPRVAESFGWPVAVWMFVPALLAMAALFWLFGQDAPSFGPRQARLADRLAVFRRQPLAWVLALFYFVTFGGFVAISIYLPTLLVGEFGLTPTDAGARAAGFVVLATFARPLGGYVADVVGGTRVLNGTFAVVAALAIVLAFGPGILVSTFAFLGIALALGLGNGAVFKLVAEYFPRETGAVTGLVGAMGGLGGFFPPLLMGVVRDLTGSYAIGFMLLSEFALLCLIVNLLALQQRAQQIVSGDHASPIHRGRDSQ